MQKEEGRAREQASIAHLLAAMTSALMSAVMSALAVTVQLRKRRHPRCIKTSSGASTAIPE